MAPGGTDSLDDEVFACSVGIMAYNEEANIAHAIGSILDQPLAHGRIEEVIVVASGCTDTTVPIVADLARKDGRVRVIVQERREGKASAINLFLAAAQAPILLMVSADVLIKEGALDTLLAPFADPRVGMVGAHPVPVNDANTFLGHAVHLVWKLHDEIARQAPKLGEVVAFRNVIPAIPRDTPVDEISIQALVSQLGYRLVYEPRAIIYNRGPATIREFIRQRRRIYCGHLQIRVQQGYSASTMGVPRVTRALLASDALSTPRGFVYTLGAVGLEATARGLAHYDHMQKREYQMWQMAKTTKSQIAERAARPPRQSVLVFHVVNFADYELEFGGRACQLVLQQIAQKMRTALAGRASVAPDRNGTIIATLAADREEAEQTAQQLITTIEAMPVRLSGARDAVHLTLTCGIIAFLHTGQPLMVVVPAPV